MVRRALVTTLLLLLAACSSTKGAEPSRARPSTLSPDALPVLVSTRTIPAGTTGEDAVGRGFVKADTRPRAEFPEDAIVTTSLLRGRVARKDIPAGVVITGTMFTPSPSG
jgi:Flp pilus assembly protein CpaB